MFHLEKLNEISNYAGLKSFFFKLIYFIFNFSELISIQKASNEIPTDQKDNKSFYN